MRLTRALLGIAVAGVLVLLTGTPASAHASLISSDPEDGAVVATAPDRVVLTFNESVRLDSDAVRAYLPDGSDWEVSAQAQDNRVVVTPEEDPGTGTVVVAWTVLSEDGHEVRGALTFSIGAPSAGGTAGPAAIESSASVDIARWVALAVVVVALLVLMVLTGVAVLRPSLPEVWTHRGLHLATALVWDAAFVAALLLVPLEQIAATGAGLGEVLDWVTWLNGLTDERTLVLLGGVVVASVLVTAARRASRPTNRSRWPVAVSAAGALVALSALAAFVVVGPDVAAPPPAAAAPTGPASYSAPLGTAGTVELEVGALEGRQVQLALTLVDGVGAPLRPYAPPTLSLGNEELELGEIPLRRTGPGEYRAAATIPRDGEWTVRVSVRIDEFDNPVADVPVTVG